MFNIQTSSIMKILIIDLHNLAGKEELYCSSPDSRDILLHFANVL